MRIADMLRIRNNEDSHWTCCECGRMLGIGKSYLEIGRGQGEFYHPKCAIAALIKVINSLYDVQRKEDRHG